MILLSDATLSQKKRPDNGNDNVKIQLADYGKQMHDLLSGAKADIRTYKFSVEKTESGFDLDVAIKVSFNSTKKDSESEFIAESP